MLYKLLSIAVIAFVAVVTAPAHSATLNGAMNGTLNGSVNGAINGTLNGTVNGAINGTALGANPFTVEKIILRDGKVLARIPR